MLRLYFLSRVFYSGILSFFLVTSSYAMNKNIFYYEGSYSPTHWAMQPRTLDDPKMIALASYEKHIYAFFLNPTDKRGYRCIVMLIDDKNPESTFNRTYTQQEYAGLMLCTSFMMNVYQRLVPLVQISIAGNNAQAFDTKNNLILVGKSAEPSLLHSHIWGRGDPFCCYISNVPLDGPIPGLNFDMMAKSPQEPGNDMKIKWKKEDIEAVSQRLRNEIKLIKTGYEEEFKINIIVE